jgi:hypothetical protein
MSDTKSYNRILDTALEDAEKGNQGKSKTNTQQLSQLPGSVYPAQGEWDTASLFAKWTFSVANPMLMRGLEGPLAPEDFMLLPEHERVRGLLEKVFPTVSVLLCSFLVNLNIVTVHQSASILYFPSSRLIPLRNTPLLNCTSLTMNGEYQISNGCILIQFLATDKAGLTYEATGDSVYADATQPSTTADNPKDRAPRQFQQVRKRALFNGLLPPWVTSLTLMAPRESFVAMVMAIVEGVVRVGVAVLLGQLLSAMEEARESESYGKAYGLAIVLGCSGFVQCLVHHVLFYLTYVMFTFSSLPFRYRFVIVWCCVDLLVHLPLCIYLLV